MNSTTLEVLILPAMRAALLDLSDSVALHVLIGLAILHALSKLVERGSSWGRRPRERTSRCHEGRRLVGR